MEPTIVVLASAMAIMAEADRTSSVGIAIGMDNAVKVLRGPLFADADGHRIDASAHHGRRKVDRTEAGFGAMVLGISGACWALPECKRTPCVSPHA
jgi:hypothetical protein